MKKEALVKFDNDYDVLFSAIKDYPISDVGNVKDFISRQFPDDTMLEEIEEKLPLLTIYVSDVTWLDPDGFCPQRWDTEDNRLAVTYKSDDGLCCKLFSNGSFIGTIAPGTIPGGTVLIVKDNERIVADLHTKSGQQYRFIDEAFNNIKTKGDHRHTGKYTVSWIQGQDPEDNSDLISAECLNRLNPDIINAYEMFENMPYALQNDYIYYGMTSSNPRGQLRNDVRSKIVRFKIDPDSFDYLFDEQGLAGEKGDIGFVDSFEADDDGKGMSAQPSRSTIYSKLWADGSLELFLDVYTASDSSLVLFTRCVFNVRASDLFTIKDNAIKREQWGSTAFKWYVTWRYSIAERNASTLEEKWFYPESSPDLPIWDLLQNSEYVVYAYEHDSGKEVNKTINVTSKVADSHSGKIEASANIKDKVTLKTEFGWNHSDEKTISETLVVSYSDGNDEICYVPVSYRDKYIHKKVSTDLYSVYSVKGGGIQFTILPYRY